MKKSLIIAGLIAFLATSTASYATTNTPKTEMPKNKPACEKIKKQNMQKPQRPNLDERLKLTEEQKVKAHELRMKGHEKIKPVIEKMKAKREAIKQVIEDTKLTQEQKDKKIYAIEKELLELKQQARKIRTENMKEFEALLTEEQKAELQKIKQEAREMRANGPKGPHKPHRPYGPQPRGEFNPPETPNK